ncbi:MULTISPECIES: hypothetical protein [Olivibacter]|uniref:Outer membrane protein assembly factor BamB n=1 Tax=Olivibacter oleidegradans TaxID=760123 RepID=A0ABV6HSH0_9SPHI|nr:MULTISPECIES: hypothetical protein [Olivibacter]QEL03989.1 hypothetical protein FKG96_25195 [Olivibacter sp. LS-1]
MRKLIIITSILFVAVIAAAILYFTSLQSNSRNQNNALAYIPADAAFLVSFQNDKSFYNIFNDFKIFEAILGKETQHELSYLHKQFLKSPDFSEPTTKQTLYFSFHPTKDRINWLLTIPFKTKLTPENAASMLQKNLEGVGTITADSTSSYLYSIKIRALDNSFYVAFRSGVAFFSHQRDLIARATDDKATHLSADFLQELAKNGHKNDNSILNLHLNHSEVFKFVNNLIRTKPGNNIQLLEGLKGMSSLNMNFKSDALMFSGLSSMDHAMAKGNYLSIYAKQSAVEGELKRVLPANTAAYAAFALSNYKGFHQELTELLKKRNQLNRINDQLALIKSSKKIDLDTALLNQWGNEFASIELTTRETLGIIKVKDSLIFERNMEKLTTAVTEDIRRFDNSNLLYYSFGDPMLPFQRPYFTLINNYLICANTISTLQQLRKQYEEKQLLINTIPFIEFSRLQANKSNVTFFIHNENAKLNIKRLLKPAFEKVYNDTANFNFKDFQAFSFQLSGYNGNFYSNLSAKYLSADKSNLQAEWVADLSSEIAYPPSVWTYTDSTNFIVTQDKSNRLYAFSTEGKELWRTALSGPILGPISQLPDKSLVFNTAERLYRFAPNGSPMFGFPIVLNHPATAGMTLFRVNKDYEKIFIPAEQRILGYDSNGKELPEWKNKTVKGHILFNLKTALLEDFNYVIALTSSGQVYLFNHNGNLVSLLESTGNDVFRNNFGVETNPSDQSESRIVTTDTSGMLVSFYFDKRQTKTSLGKWTENFHFATENIQGDSIPELIFADDRQLYAYSSKDSTLLFSHNFNTEIAGPPLFFPSANKTHTIGITTNAKLLYVFEDDGSIAKGFPLEGYAPFYFGGLKNDGHRYALISKDGRKLAAYKLD